MIIYEIPQQTFFEMDESVCQAYKNSQNKNHPSTLGTAMRAAIIANITNKFNTKSTV